MDAKSLEAGYSNNFLLRKFKGYYELMKPRVMSLVIFTAFVGMFLAPGQITFLNSFLVIVAIALGAGLLVCGPSWRSRRRRACGRSFAQIASWDQLQPLTLHVRTQTKPMNQQSIGPCLARSACKWSSTSWPGRNNISLTDLQNPPGGERGMEYPAMDC